MELYFYPSTHLHGVNRDNFLPFSCLIFAVFVGMKSPVVVFAV
jgi:hypothetical protein